MAPDGRTAGVWEVSDQAMRSSSPAGSAAVEVRDTLAKPRHAMPPSLSATVSSPSAPPSQALEKAGAPAAAVAVGVSSHATTTVTLADVAEQPSDTAAVMWKVPTEAGTNSVACPVVAFRPTRNGVPVVASGTSRNAPSGGSMLATRTGAVYGRLAL